MLYKNTNKKKFGNWQWYHIDSPTVANLKHVARVEQVHLETLLNEILTRVYKTDLRSVYVLFGDSYSIFSKDNYCQNIPEYLEENLEGLAERINYQIQMDTII